MKENRDEYYSLSEIMNQTKQFLYYLTRRWLFFIIAILAGCGLGFLYYNTQKPKYRAVTTFILEEKSGGGSGLAGLASQFGFNVGSIAGGASIFAGDNILSILQSKKVVEEVLLSPVDSSVQKRTLADLYVEFSHINKKGKTIVPLSFSSSNTSTINSQQDSVLNVIYEKVLKNNLSVERVSKQASIIKVQVIAQNSAFARLMSERLVEAASKLYLEIKTGTALANIEQMQRRSDSLLALLNRKTYVAAASQPLDINPGIKSGVVPVEIATRDKTVIATLYTEVTKNLEASKLLLSQQTPVIQLLDRPVDLLDDNKKSLFFVLFISCVITGAIYMAVCFLLFLFYREKQIIPR